MARFTSMVDMAKTPADVKEETKNYPTAAMPPSPSGDGPKVPVYPYGLCMSWDEEILKKLGMEDELPEVGDTIHICMMATVTSVSESERVDEAGNKTKCCRIELQGTHIAVEDEDDENETVSRRGRFYDRVDGDGGKEAA